MGSYTVGLALLDAIPVLFFGGSMLLVAQMFGYKLFMVGAVIAFVGGALQALWKLFLGWKKKDIPILHLLFPPALAIGFMLMMLGLLFGRELLNFPAMLAAVTGMPSLVLFIVGVVGLFVMAYLSKKLDRKSPKQNWIAPTVNAVAEACIFFALLLIRL